MWSQKLPEVVSDVIKINFPGEVCPQISPPPLNPARLQANGYDWVIRILHSGPVHSLLLKEWEACSYIVITIHEKVNR
jgi:hypothetical protein